MDKLLSGQRGPLMVKTPENDDKGNAGSLSNNAGKGFFGSIAKKRFSKAVNLVKFAMKFENNPLGDDKSMMTDKSQPAVQMENTYRMEPEETTRFSVKKTQDVIQETFDDHLARYVYSKTTAPHLVQTLTTVIKDKVKKLGFPRYKYVVNVYIGQCAEQCLVSSSRCLWDAKKDNYAYAQFTGKGYFAMGTVHAVYFE